MIPSITNVQLNAQNLQRHIFWTHMKNALPCITYSSKGRDNKKFWHFRRRGKRKAAAFRKQKAGTNLDGGEERNHNNEKVNP